MISASGHGCNQGRLENTWTAPPGRYHVHMAKTSHTAYIHVDGVVKQKP